MSQFTRPIRLDASRPRDRAVPGLVLLWPPPPAGDGAWPLREELVIGRVGKADVGLEDETASRQHARVARAGGGYVVQDLGSRNGTRLNGDPLRSLMPFDPGDLLMVGSSLLACVEDCGAFEGWRAAAAAPARAATTLVGGPAMARVRSLVERFGPSDLAVLVQGETGTGKELVATAVHEASRRPGPLVPVNCAAIPPQLFEAELFGARRGAFTGADTDRPGLVRAAHRGTLFLDELGELTPECQAKLLRVIEKGEVLSLGASAPERVDLRVVAATNRPLDEEIAGGRFRRDLYQRLAAVTIWIPPLRDRPEDIVLLCAHVLARAAGAGLGLSPEAIEAACLYAWPGNVRELEQTVRAAVVQARADGAPRIDPAHLPPAMDRGRSGYVTTGSLGRVEHALREHGGNVARAAKALGMHRAQVYELLRRHGKTADEYRD